MSEEELTGRLDAWLRRVDGYWYLRSELDGEPPLKASLINALMGRPIRFEPGITQEKERR